MKVIRLTFSKDRQEKEAHVFYQGQDGQNMFCRVLEFMEQ